MNYKFIYDSLIEKTNKRVNFDGNYYETHHILPRCMGGSDEKENLVKLTAKEHYLAHYLLVKMYKDTEHISKLICAFRFMTVDGHGGKRHKNSMKDYAWMREMFSKYHPMKDPDISAKTSVGLKAYWENLDDLERDKFSKAVSNGLKTYHKKLSVDQKKKLSDIAKESLSRPEVRSKISVSLKEYYSRETSDAKESRMAKYMLTTCGADANLKRSETWKDKLSKMTPDELSERSKKSWCSSCPIKRGKAISAGKKGKPTNQQNIMGNRYAKMNDEEFNSFLETKDKTTHTRITNLRNKYKND